MSLFDFFKKEKKIKIEEPISNLLNKVYISFRVNFELKEENYIEKIDLIKKFVNEEYGKDFGEDWKQFKNLQRFYQLNFSQTLCLAELPSYCKKLDKKLEIFRNKNFEYLIFIETDTRYFPTEKEIERIKSIKDYEFVTILTKKQYNFINPNIISKKESQKIYNLMKKKGLIKETKTTNRSKDPKWFKEGMKIKIK